MKPFCYGMPSVVSAASKTCQGCTFSSGCVAAGSQLLEAAPDDEFAHKLRRELAVARKGLGATEVVASSRGVTRVALNPAEAGLVDALPARVGSQVRQLLQRGWFEFARAEMAAGRNPGEKGWKKVLCRLLMEGSRSRSDLVLALQKELGLSPASAKTQASVAMAVFAAGRLAYEVDGRLQVRANCPRSLS